MQQTFQCYKCGAQNYFGQPLCWNCQAQFQYNCPTCGAIADIQFINCTKCGAVFPWPIKQLEEPSLHILTLDPGDKRLVGALIKGHPKILLPAITTNGRISSLTVANNNDFLKLQNDILHKIKHDWKESKTHVCAGVNYVHPKNPLGSVLIYQVTGSHDVIPEIENMYSLLTRLSNSIKGDDYWTQVEAYFGTEPRKSWINELIVTLRNTLHWNETVDRELAKLE